MTTAFYSCSSYGCNNTKRTLFVAHMGGGVAVKRTKLRFTQLHSHCKTWVASPGGLAWCSELLELTIARYSHSTDFIRGAWGGVAAIRRGKKHFLKVCSNDFVSNLSLQGPKSSDLHLSKIVGSSAIGKKQ